MTTNAQPMSYPKILAAIGAHQWAIMPEALDGIRKALSAGLSADDRHLFHLASEQDYRAVTEDFGSRIQGTTAYVRGSVGILDVNGPIIPRADFFSDISGITSIERLSAGARALESNPDVKDIVLFMDSPGGVAFGGSELAKQIRALEKPTTTFVFGLMASLGYWIGSASDRIVVSDVSLSGSVGVIISPSVEQDGKTIDIVSEQSPNKRLDASTPEGQADYQRIVNALGQVFVEAAAEHRSVSVEHVLTNFGRGSMLTAKEAVAAGMVDNIMSFSDLLADLGGTNKTTAGGGRKTEAKAMDVKTLKAEHPETAEALVAEGVAQERNRVSAHLTLAEASGSMKDAVEDIKAGEQVTVLTNAKHQAAMMAKIEGKNRVADNPDTLVPAGTGASDADKQAADDKLAADIVVASLGGGELEDYE